jgi:hypothetical protein
MAPVLKKVLYSTSDQLEQCNQTCKGEVNDIEALFLYNGYYNTKYNKIFGVLILI